MTRPGRKMREDRKKESNDGPEIPDGGVCVCETSDIPSLPWGVGGGWMANHTHRYLYHVFGGDGQSHSSLLVSCLRGDGQSHSSLLVCLWGGRPITLIITCIMSLWGDGQSHSSLLVSWGGGGFRYPLRDLPPPNDVHNLQSLQGARRKLTSQFDYYLHLDIVTPREREKLSLLQQTNVTISTCKSANSKQCSTQHHGHVRTLVYGSVYKAGYQ